MMQPDELLRARRFSAVILVLPEGTALNSAYREVSRATTFEGTAIDAHTSWHVRQGTFTARRSYFRSQPKEAFALDDGYEQALFVATSTLNVRGIPRTVALLAAPYIRMLEEFVSKLDNAVPYELQFVTVNMEETFKFFHDRSFDWMQATRITVADNKDQGVSLVAMSGRHPLRSALRLDLEKKLGPAHAIRLNSHIAKYATQVHADKFGNFHWHLRDRAHLPNPLAALAVLGQANVLQQSSQMPTRMRLEE